MIDSEDKGAVGQWALAQITLPPLYGMEDEVVSKTHKVFVLLTITKRKKRKEL